MRKIKAKKMSIFALLIISFGVLEFTGILPYSVARISSSVYISVNYPRKRFEFESAEYSYGFGDYSVRYIDKDGSTQELGLMMFPKEFPIFVRYDSIKGAP